MFSLRLGAFAAWRFRRLLLWKGVCFMKAVLTIILAMFILGSTTLGNNFGAASALGRQKSRQAPKPKEPTASLRIPDATVYDQNGNRLKFYTDLVKGKTVAINFIFTTCTAICPALTATFRRVQTELGDRAGQDVHLISVSVDPTVDVPARLKEYAAKYKA